MTWGAIGSAAVGVVGSALLAPDGGQTSSSSKEPWEDAAPWLRENIATGQQLQQHYAQTPFNSLQQAGMQGLLSNYQHQNNTVIPGLMGFADRLMGQNYQRGQPQQPGLMASQPAQQPTQQPQMLQQQPSGMFTPPPAQQQSPINFNQMNPLYKDPAAAPPPPAPIPEGEAFRLAMADALFPESENKHRYGVSGPSLSELELRRMLGRPSNYVDIAG